MHLLTLSQTVRVRVSERIKPRLEVVDHIERVVFIRVSESFGENHQVFVSANCFECFNVKEFVILLQKCFLVFAALNRIQFIQEGHRILNLVGGQFFLQNTFSLKRVEPS